MITYHDNQENTVKELDILENGKLLTSISYYPNGNENTRKTFKDDVLDGKVVVSNDQGKVILTCNYHKGKMNGEEVQHNGEFVYHNWYENGLLIRGEKCDLQGTRVEEWIFRDGKQVSLIYF